MTIDEINKEQKSLTQNINKYNGIQLLKKQVNNYQQLKKTNEKYYARCLLETI